MWNSTLRCALDLCLAAHTTSATEISTNNPAIAVFSTGESSSFLCYCKERGSSLTLRKRLRNPGGAGDVEVDTHLSDARNDNITAKSPTMTWVRGESSV
jgi:hypothetical protein